MKQYDTFTPNILEMEGEIERKSFNFESDNLKIWQDSVCMVDSDIKLQINGYVNPYNQKIHIEFNNSNLNEYITDNFTFSEISILQDRIFWSNNLQGGFAGTLEFEPCNMSLFYYNSKLSRIYLNLSNPKEMMLELTSNSQGEITEQDDMLLQILKEGGYV